MLGILALRQCWSAPDTRATRRRTFAADRAPAELAVRWQQMATTTRANDNEQPTGNGRSFNGFSDLANLLWSVADLLRGDYKQADYGKVILIERHAPSMPSCGMSTRRIWSSLAVFQGATTYNSLAASKSLATRARNAAAFQVALGILLGRRLEQVFR